MKIKAIISAIYILIATICTICLQVAAIMIICKLCNATNLPWINCCIPVIIAILLAPILIVTKSFIEK